MLKQDFLPYGKHHITDEDIKAVVDVLKSDWLTQGPAVPEFEESLADYLGASEAVACINGTAALHLAMLALDLKNGESVITTANTFVATANCAGYVGANVLFADINSDTGLIDPESVARLLNNDTQRNIKAIIPVHFAGQPVDLPKVYDLAKRHGARVVDDACHALGAAYQCNDLTYKLGGNPHSDLTVFSFHPVKHIAMGEGGAVVTNDDELAERLRHFRSHGIIRREFSNEAMAGSADGVPNPWYYEMTDIGFNYRLTDIQAALGKSQLSRMPKSLRRRGEIAETYRRLISETFANGEVRPLTVKSGVSHAYHLFVVLVDFAHAGVSRAVVMNRMRSEGIGTQVHYIPVHQQPYYRRTGSSGKLELPGVEAYYNSALSLPMYPELSDEDISRVVKELDRALKIQPATAPTGAHVKQDSHIS
jgi:UDP-4-amino-4,6-dideoxy-N-acetyl-beta-L-altrosamine transaminase